MSRTFALSALFVFCVLPASALAMGAEPPEEETRREEIEKTQSPDGFGQQRDSGNLFDAYAAWKERRKENAEEKPEDRFLPTEESLRS